MEPQAEPEILTQYSPVSPRPSSPPSKFSDSPLISEKMLASLKTVKSGYHDTFDYTIYDRLYRQYGQNQPWRGVVFKTTFKLVNYHSSCSKCHYAFELDTYGRGCIHDCVYCYAKDQLTQHGTWNRPQPFPVDFSKIRKIFYTVFETDKRSRWRPILERRIPLRLGSMSDSFMWMDRKYRVTQAVLRLLKFYRYPYIVFTRSDLIAEEDYLKELDRGLAAIQFYISGNNESLTRLLEPAAPSYQRRIKALAKLAKGGFWTTVRINPVLPTFPDGYFSIPDETNRHDSLKTK